MAADEVGGYDGPATLVADGRRIDVAVRLRGYFEPIDGHVHWYGRVAAAGLCDVVSSGTTVDLDTGAGPVSGRVADPDPWGRLRITGTGSPPFRNS